MKIKLCKNFDSPNNSHPNSRLMKAKISTHLTKKRGVVPCTKHNHTTEYLNRIKINSIVKTAIIIEVSCGYVLVIINKILQEIK